MNGNDAAMGRWIKIIVVVSAIVMLVVGVLGVAFRHELYFGPPLAPADDLAEWRAIGAEAWGVDAPGSWDPVREVLRAFDEAEADARISVPPPEGWRAVEAVVAYDPDSSIGLDYQYVYDFADDRDVAGWEWHLAIGERARAALIADGFPERLAALPDGAPVADAIYGFDFGTGTDPIMTDVSATRRVMRFLAIEFRVAADAGDAEMLRRSGLAMVGLTRVVGACPSQIGLLSAVAMESMVRAGLERAINMGLDASTADAAEEVFAGLRPADAARAFRGETVAARAFFRRELGHGWLTRYSASASDEARRMLETAMLEALEMDADAGDDHVRGVAAGLLTGPLRTSSFVSAEREHGGEFEFASSMQRLVRRERFFATALGLGLALESHRVRTGAFPASLDELVGSNLAEVPTDVVGGQPFRYEVGDDPTLPAARGGCRLWSVGADGADDGGRLLADYAHEALLARGAGSDYVILGPAAAALLD